MLHGTANRGNCGGAISVAAPRALPPEPVPGAGQVLVKTLACGICGSDLHARKHAHRMADMRRFLSTNRKPMDPSRDVVFGHEFCCEVIDHGPSTQKRFKPGTRVCSVPGLVSAEGPQGIGYSNENVGGYAERMLLSEALLLEVPNGLSAEHAAPSSPSESTGGTSSSVFSSKPERKLTEKSIFSQPRPS